MKSFCMAVLLVAVSGWSAVGAKDEPLVVHEWGVMVRSSVLLTDDAYTKEGIVRAPGQPVDKAKPFNMLAAPIELLADMPAFVTRHDANYQPKWQHRVWTKPVIHFYGKEGQAVEARLRTPCGHPLAYFPKPKLIEETAWFMGSGRTDAVGMTWSGTLSKKPNGREPKVQDGHWWNVARTIPSMYFHGEGGDERFIFWEASGLQEPLISASVGADSLDLKNAYTDASGQVLVIVNDGARRGWLAVKDVPANGSIRLKKEDFFKAESGDDALLAAARAQWESFGMTREEARAIVDIWKSDLLASKGFLVVSRVPTKVFGELFPLEVLPKPDALVRAGVVFDTVPGEKERIGWLLELKKQMNGWSNQLGDEEFDVREKAFKAFAQAGDLAMPVLEELTKSADLNVSAAAKRLLAQLQPRKMERPQPPLSVEKGD